MLGTNMTVILSPRVQLTVIFVHSENRCVPCYVRAVAVFGVSAPSLLLRAWNLWNLADLSVSHRAVNRPVSPTRWRVGENRDGESCGRLSQLPCWLLLANPGCKKKPSRFCLSGVSWSPNPTSGARRVGRTSEPPGEPSSRRAVGEAVRWRAAGERWAAHGYGERFLEQKTSL